jgi:hypothetical protein
VPANSKLSLGFHPVSEKTIPNNACPILKTIFFKIRDDGLPLFDRQILKHT